MTDLRALVEQMRALSEKASPAPWRPCGATRPEGNLCTCGQIWSIPDDQVVAVAHYHARWAGLDEGYTVEQMRHNEAFIAACREGVPALLDALAGAEKEKTAAEAGRILTQESMQRWIDFHNDRADKAEARLSKLLALGRQVVEAQLKTEKVGGCRCGERETCPLCDAEMARDTALDAFKAELGSDPNA